MSNSKAQLIEVARSSLLVRFLQYLLIVLTAICLVNCDSPSVQESQSQPARTAVESSPKVSAAEHVPLPVSVSTLANKTPDEVAKLLKRSQDVGSRTPSGKVLATSYVFDGYDIQLDHDLTRGRRCIYIGVSFAERPVSNEVAWKVVGFPEPSPKQAGRNVIWESGPGIKPFKEVRRILYGTTGLVGKLAFSTTTLEESNSLYSTE